LELTERATSAEKDKLRNQIATVEAEKREAEPLYRRAIEIYQANFGPEHPKTLMAKSNYDSLRRLIDQKSGDSAR
jgi:hypothetical protein